MLSYTMHQAEATQAPPAAARSLSLKPRSDRMKPAQTSSFLRMNPLASMNDPPFMGTSSGPVCGTGVGNGGKGCATVAGPRGMTGGGNGVGGVLGSRRGPYSAVAGFPPSKASKQSCRCLRLGSSLTASWRHAQ
mmetsp:Transcript_56717/g.105013  ORF Transcript_56717/g.105013 Transcript_56717/m.105013 type:complete len:134 (-) Transcript_56717:1209-1610(-)